VTELDYLFIYLIARAFENNRTWDDCGSWHTKYSATDILYSQHFPTTSSLPTSSLPTTQDSDLTYIKYNIISSCSRPARTIIKARVVLTFRSIRTTCATGDVLYVAGRSRLNTHSCLRCVAHHLTWSDWRNSACALFSSSGDLLMMIMRCALIINHHISYLSAWKLRDLLPCKIA
jgi:hypothetical protein